MMKPAAQRRRGALGWVIILLLAALALFTLIAVFSYLAGYVALSVRTIANLELKHCVQRGTCLFFGIPIGYLIDTIYFFYYYLIVLDTMLMLLLLPGAAPTTLFLTQWTILISESVALFRRGNIKTRIFLNWSRAQPQCQAPWRPAFCALVKLRIKICI